LLAYQALVSIGQSVIIVALGPVAGARFANGVAGVAVLLVAGMLVNLAFSSLSVALSLVLRKEESVIAAVQLVALPLTFLGAGFMAERLMPGWIRAVATTTRSTGPWRPAAGRWRPTPTGGSCRRGGGLLALALGCGLLATVAFRSYQRSV
jgi:ABC-2 type transport system permease protein